MKLKKLSGNQLKILAALFMTIDHIGVMIFTQSEILRIIGRLSMPIFAYMISEGAHYTKNRKKYLSVLIVMSAIIQITYYLVERSLDQCILVTFSLSIMLIYIIDRKNIILSLLALTACFYLTQVVNIDYGFFGIVLPLLIYLGENKTQKLILMTSGLVLVSLTNSPIQWYSLLSVPLVALYNGKRGKLRMKNFFYIYYPLHLLIIYFISIL
ncbi:MAG: hypothetical protein IKK18_02500 [Clostridia bacterium]|nr:hypothetical protein [Clostridia bacterium]